MPKVLVANRGEIAVRVLRTLRVLGVPSVAVYSDLDQDAPHVFLADETVGLGEPRSYLDIERVVAAATAAGATAVHPGYGFLSENPAFSQACRAAGLVFIGPSPEAMRAFGDKREARQLADQIDVPVVPGAHQCESVADAAAAAERVGFPILLKAAGGGGGKGMRQVAKPEALAEAFAGAAREAKAAFNDARLLVEKYIYPARHIEVQVLGDGNRAVAIGERECSLQRRYQKVVEEAPASSIPDEVRAALRDAAVRLIAKAAYSGAGTVEFLVGPKNDFYFLEVNARLQVEHPVTELISGLDLVAEQMRIANGGPLPAAPALHGHAIEVRLNAEDAYGGFLPAAGVVRMLRWPSGPGLRIDAGIEEGSEVGSDYDPLLAKIIAWGDDREQARRRLLQGLRETVVLGLHTNLGFLVEVLDSDCFRSRATYTTTLEAQHWQAPEPPPYALQVADKKAVQAGRQGPSSHVATLWEQLGRFRML